MFGQVASEAMSASRRLRMSSGGSPRAATYGWPAGWGNSGPCGALDVSRLVLARFPSCQAEVVVDLDDQRQNKT